MINALGIGFPDLALEARASIAEDAKKESLSDYVACISGCKARERKENRFNPPNASTPQRTRGRP